MKIEQCGNCNARFIRNHEKKITKSIIGLLALTFVLGFLDLGLIGTSIILIPYIVLTFLYIKRIEIDKGTNEPVKEKDYPHPPSAGS
jgi:hypothetical protein